MNLENLCIASPPLCSAGEQSDAIRCCLLGPNCPLMWHLMDVGMNTQYFGRQRN